MISTYPTLNIIFTSLLRSYDHSHNREHFGIYLSLVPNCAIYWNKSLATHPDSYLWPLSFFKLPYLCHLILQIHTLENTSPDIPLPPSYTLNLLPWTVSSIYFQSESTWHISSTVLPHPTLLQLSVFTSLTLQKKNTAVNSTQSFVLVPTMVSFLVLGGENIFYLPFMTGQFRDQGTPQRALIPYMLHHPSSSNPSPTYTHQLSKNSEYMQVQLLESTLVSCHSV